MTEGQRFINIGYRNMLCVDKILAILNPEPAPIKRLVAEHKEQNKVIDVTHGRRTRSIIVTDSDYIVLSSLLPETISSRFAKDSE